MTPRRIQRSRAKGWRMAPGAVYIGRGTAWGNPFRADRPDEFPNHVARDLGATSAADAFRRWLRKDPGFDTIMPERRDAILSSLPAIRGKTLACFCPIGSPCHGDVLLALANPSALKVSGTI